jgi:hypothetical protein
MVLSTSLPKLAENFEGTNMCNKHGVDVETYIQIKMAHLRMLKRAAQAQALEEMRKDGLESTGEYSVSGTNPVVVCVRFPAGRVGRDE